MNGLQIITEAAWPLRSMRTPRSQGELSRSLACRRMLTTMFYWDGQVKVLPEQVAMMEREADGCLVI